MLIDRCKGIGFRVPMQWTGVMGIFLLCAGENEPTYFRYPVEAGEKTYGGSVELNVLFVEWYPEQESWKGFFLRGDACAQTRLALALHVH